MTTVAFNLTISRNNVLLSVKDQWKRERKNVEIWITRQDRITVDEKWWRTCARAPRIPLLETQFVNEDTWFCSTNRIPFRCTCDRTKHSPTEHPPRHVRPIIELNFMRRCALPPPSFPAVYSPLLFFYFFFITVICLFRMSLVATEILLNIRIRHCIHNVD